MNERSQSEIYLRKRLKVIVRGKPGRVDRSVVTTAAKNLQALGFGLSGPLLERLSELSHGDVKAWYESVLPILQEMVGAHREFKPMYPNFPRQVMEVSDAELYFNAMTHYFGFYLSDLLDDPNFVVLPNYEKEIRPLLKEFHELRWIDLGSEEGFDAIFTRLVGGNGSLSESDQEVVRWFLGNRSIEALLPEEIPQKETLAFLVAEMEDPRCLVPRIKTATDVLRVAVAMSQGDVSLAQPTKFRSFTKRERRFLLECLEQTGDSRTEDMLRWKPRWVRLGERLHPGDYHTRFPKAYQAFTILRNDLPYPTFNGQAEAAIAKAEAASTIQLLSQRPGDFARRLDHVLRTHQGQEAILDGFLSVAPQVSTPVLLQAWCHFQHRQSITSRAFFPKGNAAKVQFQEGALPPLSGSIAEAAAAGIRRVLVERFAKLPPLGKCYLDPRLQDQIVPFAQRSASRALRAITRGSCFDLPEGDTVRFFCWWKNIDAADEWMSRVDLDLSGSLFAGDWESMGDIAYYNLRRGDCYHSGDITSAPQGACEFIDISLKSVLKMGARYVVMSVLSFTRQPFLALPECFGGWMMRQKPNSGEVFEPKTVQDKIDITAESRACVPVIIDAQDRQVYWADLSLKSMGQINNAARNSVGFSQIGRSIVELTKPTLYDLFAMHIDGRGQLAETPEEAEVVFGLYEGTVTAFEGDVVLSDYLA